MVKNKEKFMRQVAEVIADLAEGKVIPKQRRKSKFQTKLITMDWSVRAMNVFIENDIETIEDLTDLGRKGVLELYNIGKGTMEEIDYKLAEFNIILK